MPLKLTPYGRVVAKYGAFPFEWLASPAKAQEIGLAIRDGLTEAEVRRRCNVHRLPRGFYEEAKEALSLSKEEAS